LDKDRSNKRAKKNVFFSKICLLKTGRYGKKDKVKEGFLVKIQGLG